MPPVSTRRWSDKVQVLFRGNSERMVRHVTLQTGSHEILIDDSPLPRCPGSNFRDKALVQPGDECLLICPSVGFRLFALVFASLGGALLGLCAYLLMGHPAKAVYWTPGVFGFILFPAGLLLLLSRRSFWFDREYGELRIRRLGFAQKRPLRDVAAIQLVEGGWHASGGKNGIKSAYFTYQLNLILNNREILRLNMSNHNDWDWSWQTGRQLADFLEVPFVDMASEEEQ
jgi:hypothetical protein